METFFYIFAVAMLASISLSLPVIVGQLKRIGDALGGKSASDAPQRDR